MEPSPNILPCSLTVRNVERIGDKLIASAVLMDRGRAYCAWKRGPTQAYIVHPSKIPLTLIGMPTVLKSRGIAESTQYWMQSPIRFHIVSDNWTLSGPFIVGADINMSAGCEQLCIDLSASTFGKWPDFEVAFNQARLTDQMRAQRSLFPNATILLPSDFSADAIRAMQNWQLVQGMFLVLYVSQDSPIPIVLELIDQYSEKRWQCNAYWAGEKPGLTRGTNFWRCVESVAAGVRTECCAPVATII